MAQRSSPSLTAAEPVVRFGLSVVEFQPLDRTRTVRRGRRARAGKAASAASGPLLKVRQTRLIRPLVRVPTPLADRTLRLIA